MKVVGVNGSGRTGGNTAVLVNAILEGASEAGADTQLIELSDWTIGGCDACKACKTTQRCVIKDDMQQFYDVAADVDVLVLASPVYLDHITAQLMAFIQRTYCYIGMGLENLWPRKDVRAIAAITYGDGTPTGYDYILDWIEARMDYYYKIPTLAKLKIPSCSHDIVIDANHPEVQRARQLGLALKGD